MVLLESIPLKVDLKPANFTLLDPFGEAVERDSFFGEKGLLIVFTCNHCPYAIAIWDRLIALSEYGDKNGISVLAINPNINPDYPEDSPENMKLLIEEKQLPFPYLIDEDQSVAQKYSAQCTPDIYLLDSSKNCVYHGRIDDNWKDPSSVKSEDLKAAMTALINGEPPLEDQVPSMGCSIKWND